MQHFMSITTSGKKIHTIGWRCSLGKNCLQWDAFFSKVVALKPAGNKLQTQRSSKKCSKIAAKVLDDSLDIKL